MRSPSTCSITLRNINCDYCYRSLVMEQGSGEMRSALSLLIPFFSCWLCMAVSFLLRHSECSGRSTVRGWHSLCAEVDQHYLYSAIGVLQHTRVCRMRCSVVSIAWSQRAIKLHSSRCAARKMLFNTCPSNPISSRSSMVSSNWCCNLMAAINPMKEEELLQ